MRLPAIAPAALLLALAACASATTADCQALEKEWTTRKALCARTSRGVPQNLSLLPALCNASSECSSPAVAAAARAYAAQCRDRMSADDYAELVREATESGLLCSTAGTRFCLEAAQDVRRAAAAATGSPALGGNVTQLLDAGCVDSCAGLFQQTWPLAFDDVKRPATAFAGGCARRGAERCTETMLQMGQRLANQSERLRVGCSACSRLFRARSRMYFVGLLCTRDPGSGGLCSPRVTDAIRSSGLAQGWCSADEGPTARCLETLRQARQQLGCCAAELLEWLPWNVRPNATAVLGGLCGRPASANETARAAIHLRVGNVRGPNVTAAWAALQEPLRYDLRFLLGVETEEVAGLSIAGSGEGEAVVLDIVLVPMSNAYSARELVDDANEALRSGTFTLSALASPELLVDPFQPLAVEGTAQLLEVPTDPAQSSSSAQGRSSGTENSRASVAQSVASAAGSLLPAAAQLGTLALLWPVMR
eukprot:m51a1_g13568 hypothetical protein (480) ;mRNA; r:10-1522